MLTNNTQENLIKGIMRHGPEVLGDSLIDPKDIIQYLERIATEHLDYPVPKENIDTTNWYIPQKYKDLDIEDFLVNQCPKENYDRLILELELYQKHQMLDVLRTMKYIVDTLRNNNIVWGVGRGSSVASYVLFLLGVHKIDSVKYNIPIEEFFKGDQNG
jgi:DNA polymerase III alpha subunit